MLVIGCSGAQTFAEKLAQHLSASHLKAETDFFPDSEVRTKIPLAHKIKNKTVLVVQLFFPKTNDKILETLFIQDTLQRKGAKEIFLVAPYFPYLREDKEFHPGESVAAKIMPHLFSTKRFENIFIIDPHLHRLSRFAEFFPNAIRFTTTDILASFIKKNITRPVLVGPDAESFQWDKTIAQKIDCPVTILHKDRYSSEHVAVKSTEPIENVIPGNDIILVDDIIGTGHTMYEAIKTINRYRPRSIHCFGVHGLFLDASIKRKIKQRATIHTTNTVISDTTDIDITPAFATFLKSYLTERKKGFIKEKKRVVEYVLEKLKKEISQKTVLGIGSGTTMERFAKNLGALNIPITVVSSSETITTILKKYPHITLLSNTKNGRKNIDIAIDGADEVDMKKNILKGQGAFAYKEEKRIDYAAQKTYILVDYSKLNTHLTKDVLVHVPKNRQHVLSDFLLSHHCWVRRHAHETYFLHFPEVSSYKKLENTLDGNGLQNGIFTQFKKKPKVFIGYPDHVDEL